MSEVKIAIIGAGPAGLTLALLLRRANIDCVILEFRSQRYVESRVRAGLLEQNTVDLFKELGAGDRMVKEGLVHRGVNLSFDGERIRVPFDELTGGRCITIYGQQEVLKDLSWEMHWLEGADHSFHVLKSSGRTDRDVLAEVGSVTGAWLKARPAARR